MNPLNDCEVQDAHEKCESDGYNSEVNIIEFTDWNLELIETIIEETCNKCGYKERYKRKYKLQEVD